MGYSLGVDVGTTYTAVGICRSGRAEIAPLGARGWSVPSVVYLGADQSVLVGEPAVRRSATDPLRVVSEFKRRIGDPVPHVVGGAPVSADTLTGMVLRTVTQQVVALESGPPEHVVITHPANWGLYKIDCLWQAIRLAGLDELCPISVMSEPEAAATYYASNERLTRGDVVAVYDLGGGTFDAAVVRRTDTSWEPLAPAEGIERLGGIDFDAAVLSYVDQATDGHVSELDPTDAAAMAAVLQLRRDCIDAKEALSSDIEATIRVALPTQHTDVRLTRSEFESMIEPSIRLSVNALRRVLHSADVTADQLHAVLLVGGSSRIPLVSQIVAQTLKVAVAVDAHPKHSIALGAAITAHQRAQDGEHVPETPDRDGTQPMDVLGMSPPPGSPPPDEAPTAALRVATTAAPGDGDQIPSEPEVAGASGRGRRIALLAGIGALVVAITVGAVLIVGNRATGTTSQSSGAPTASTASESSVAATSSTAGVSASGLPISVPLADDQLIAPLVANGNLDLYAVDARSGAVLTRLTTNPTEARSPTLSPDRRSIIYSEQTESTRSQHVMAADGTGDRPLFKTTPTGCTRTLRPAWNPVEPEVLALVCIDGVGAYSLQIVRVDGTVLRVVSTGLPRIDDVAFSPDGGTLTFWGSELSEFDGGSIYVMPADGSSGPTRLTEEKVGTDADPMWSPDGTEITFRRRMPNGTARGNFNIFVMKPDGTGLTQLTDHPAHDQDPVWSPDGSMIVFKSERDGADAAAANRLWIMNRDGSNQRLLVGGEYRAESATAWGPR